MVGSHHLIDFEYVETEDGSLSCLDAVSGELYHNRRGAFFEAEKNYAEPATLLLGRTNVIKVLDVCFGLGYNTLALIQVLSRDARWQLSKAKGQTIQVQAIDVDARVASVVPKILSQTCFSELRGRFPEVEYGGCTNSGSWIEFRNANTACRLEIEIVDFRQTVKELADHNEDVDLIFHDPFSPAKVPELWTIEIFQRYYQLLQRRAGFLFTYSCAGAVRGAMHRSGFQIYRTTAVGGKNGGTCGAINDAAFDAINAASATINAASAAMNDFAGLEPLSPQERSRLLRLGGVPYRDSGGMLSRQAIVEARKLEQSTFSAAQCQELRDNPK